MPNQLTLPLTVGNLATGFCPKTFQDILNGFAAQLSVIFPSTFSGIIVSPTKPTDTTQVWYQTDSLGRPTRIYTFAAGAWISLHPLGPGFTTIWTGAVPNFATFDGGDSNAPSQTSGPMWQVVLSQVFPVGAGTLPSGTVLTQGATGGEETHALITKELPPHNHAYGMDPQENAAQNYIGFGNSSRFADPANAIAGNFDTVAPFSRFSSTGNAGGDLSKPGTPVVPHNTMPPYQVVSFLQRTSRLYYAV